MRSLGRVVVGLGLVVGLVVVVPGMQAQGVTATRIPARVAATLPGVPLGDTLIDPGSSSPIIVPGNEATYRGKVIRQGLQYPIGSDFDFRLNKRYSRLVETIYSDDSEPSTFGIALSARNDSSGPGPEIYRYVSGDTQRIHAFSIDVRHVSVLGLSNPLGVPGATEDIVAYLVPAGATFSAPTLLAPSPDAVVQGNPLHFRWDSAPGATASYLQIWLSQPASSGGVGMNSVTTTSLRVTGTSYTLPTADYPHGIYQWRMASVSASGTSPWTPDQTVTLR